MTDEECIALAMLHGAYFWPPKFAKAESPNLTVFAIDAGFDENASCVYPDGQPTFSNGTTYASAARAYCERHHGLLEEVT